MEKIKIVIKGKHDERDDNSEFDVVMKGNMNILANALSTALCNLCIEGGTSCRKMLECIKKVYAQCTKEREEQE